MLKRIKEFLREILAPRVVINQYFTRDDGFSTSRKLTIKSMTRGEYYYWVKRNYRLPIKQKLIACDEPPAPYFTDNIVDFKVVGHSFKRNIKNCVLDIYYEEY